MLVSVRLSGIKPSEEPFFMLTGIKPSEEPFFMLTGQ
jgi:hypothetical protein